MLLMLALMNMKLVLSGTLDVLGPYIYRHHVFRTNLSDTYISNINQVNESLGIPVKTIDLNEYKEHFRTSEFLNKVIEVNEYPK
ncbi:hypothetical protein C0W40_09850 [Photobacterium leiognathi subsp. mandapamensis]|nr:hypothetical protein C0W40_09850 [Photobacterium leiognathi subsp. mandapamensis]